MRKPQHIINVRYPFCLKSDKFLNSDELKFYDYQLFIETQIYIQLGLELSENQKN